MTPYFSIIIPVYKVEEFLEKCINSVINQEFRDFEIILVDDGSPDNCPSMCEEFALKDNRVKALHKKNGGLSDARNYGLQQASGKYVLFLDSDDWWVTNYALTIVKKEADYNPDLILFDRIIYCSNGKTIHPKFRSMSEINRKTKIEALDYLISNAVFSINSCCKATKRELLIDHDIYFEKGLVSEDIDWTYKLLKHVNSIRAFDEPIYGYRRRIGSITANIGPKNISDMLWIIEKWSKEIKDYPNSSREKYLLLGYLNYQYCIINGQMGKLTIIDQKQFERRFNELEWILAYDVNKKTHLASLLMKSIGALRARRILRFYIYIKNKGLKIQ